MGLQIEQLADETLIILFQSSIKGGDGSSKVIEVCVDFGGKWGGKTVAVFKGIHPMTYQFLTFGISALWTCILTYQPGFWHISGRLAYQPVF